MGVVRVSHNAQPFCIYLTSGELNPSTYPEVICMKRSIPVWQLIGFIFTALLGTFLHFLFDLTDGNIIAALFSAVNESIWEHMKLLFYPMVIFSLFEYFSWGKNVPGFWWIKLFGILLGLVLIPVLYYTYTGIWGINADWFNITIFFLAAAAAYRFECYLFQKKSAPSLTEWIPISLILTISLLFTGMTFYPPEIPFFQDPLTGTYGYQKTGIKAWL